MTLETHISGSEDKLLSGLHFQNQNTASYVIRRELATFPPQQASNFKSTGVRLMRFSLAEQQGWLVGSTLRLAMTIVNGGTSTITPNALSPASMFRRLRVIANGGATLEDIEQYGRCHQMFSHLLPPDELMCRVSEEWGNTTTSPNLGSPGAGQPIPAGEARTVVFSLMSSFLNQGKYIPLNFVPVVIELELGEVSDAFVGLAMDWYIQRPQILADVVHLDMTLQNSYARHVIEGKSLPLNFQGMYSLQASIPSGSTQYTFPIVRGFTRLNKVYFSFNTLSGSPIVNFGNPLNGGNNVADEDTFSWYAQVGSERFPSFDVTSMQESYYRLRQMHPGPISIHTFWYSDTRFISGFSLERVPHSASFTGMNTRSGAQLTFNFKKTGTMVLLHVVLVYDAVANISSAGVELLD